MLILIYYYLFVNLYLKTYLWQCLHAQAGLIGQDSSQQLLTSIPSGWTNPSAQQPRGPWKKIPKKTKIAQSAWCEICKIECNTKDILYKHKLGKKHIKNIEKLNTAASLTFGTTSTSNPNPIIGPLENPKNLNPNLIPKKKKVETPQELEMKRRKVVEGGASVNAVRTCTICNVVCNSDTVFRFHLGGQKHISMLKKSHQGSGTVWEFEHNHDSCVYLSSMLLWLIDILLVVI